MSATATTVQQGPGRDSVPELSHRQVLIVFAGLIVGMILAVSARAVVRAEAVLGKLGEDSFRIGAVVAAGRGRPRVEYR